MMTPPSYYARSIARRARHRAWSRLFGRLAFGFGAAAVACMVALLSAPVPLDTLLVGGLCAFGMLAALAVQDALR